MYDETDCLLQPFTEIRKIAQEYQDYINSQKMYSYMNVDVTMELVQS